MIGIDLLYLFATDTFYRYADTLGVADSTSNFIYGLLSQAAISYFHQETYTFVLT